MANRRTSLRRHPTETNGIFPARLNRNQTQNPEGRNHGTDGSPARRVSFRCGRGVSFAALARFAVANREPRIGRSRRMPRSRDSRVAQAGRLGREATRCFTLRDRTHQTVRELSARHPVPAAPSRPGWATLRDEQSVPIRGSPSTTDFDHRFHEWARIRWSAPPAPMLAGRPSCFRPVRVFRGSPGTFETCE